MSGIDTSTPVGAHMAWVIEALFAGAEITDNELRTRFANSFFEAVPIETLRAVGAQVGAEGGLIVDAYQGDDYQAVVLCHAPDGGLRRVNMTVDSATPHQIKGLRIGPGAPLEPPQVVNEVVLLNGTSSSGKTSIAKALQARLPGSWLHVSVDTFLRMANNFDSGIEPVVRGFHRSAGALASAGNRLVIDHVLERGEWLEELREALVGVPVLFVGVRCPVEVLDQRERARGDRGVGTARAQFGIVHRHGDYDVEVDTSELSADAAAERIVTLVVDGPVGTAFAHPAG